MNVQEKVNAFWNRLMLVFALMLALPVGAEACSAPGMLDEADQPHALIGSDDDMSCIDVRMSDVPTSFVGQADLPASTCVQPASVADMRRDGTLWNAAVPARGTRLHRWLCRELC